MAKNLITSSIAGSVKAPFTKAAIDNLQANIPEISSAIIQGMLGSYTTNDVIVLYGFAITITVSGTVATWTKGAVYYNGEIYQVSPGTLTKASGVVFLYSISDVQTAAAFSDGNPYPWIEVRTITITSGTSGTGIADYGAATVKPLVSLWNLNNSVSGGSATSSLGVTTISSLYNRWIKKGNVCILNYQIGVNFNSAVGKDFSLIFPLPISTVTSAFTNALYGVAGINFQGVSSFDSFIGLSFINAGTNALNISFQNTSMPANIGATYTSASIIGQFSYEIAY